MTKTEQIAILEAQRQKIINCNSFVEFQQNQINYIELLIRCFENEKLHDDFILEWIEGCK